MAKLNSDLKVIGECIVKSVGHKELTGNKKASDITADDIAVDTEAEEDPFDAVG